MPATKYHGDLHSVLSPHEPEGITIWEERAWQETLTTRESPIFATAGLMSSISLSARIQFAFSVRVSLSINWFSCWSNLFSLCFYFFFFFFSFLFFFFFFSLSSLLNAFLKSRQKRNESEELWYNTRRQVIPCQTLHVRRDQDLLGGTFFLY